MNTDKSYLIKYLPKPPYIIGSFKINNFSKINKNLRKFSRKDIVTKVEKKERI